MTQSENIRPAQTHDHAKLVQIWLEAVRASHTFLSEADILFYLPLVRDEYLGQVDLWVAVNNENTPLGFMGLSHAPLRSKIEMLFIDPDFHGQGIGKALVTHALRLNNQLDVDVNEQNPGACVFYKKCGFQITGRSELDASGKPFPILNLRYTGCSGDRD